MSQYYDMGEETLWNPSNGASRLFLGQLAIFEAELRLPSGIGPMEDDECEVDPARFEVFVNSLVARHRRTQHAVMRVLAEGFVTTVLALGGRAGVDVRWDGNDDAWGDRLRDNAQRLARSMTP
ncbi:DUF6086 family protein [Embleya sp. NPDC020630]|uniref:DUF6086 family protein n=1 Tax=Embleya sp. NPDC020630 TaxID=3363979 RepID=UPI0037BD5C12